jgi:hypothetical protein
MFSKIIKMYFLFSIFLVGRRKMEVPVDGFYNVGRCADIDNPVSIQGDEYLCKVVIELTEVAEVCSLFDL